MDYAYQAIKKVRSGVAISADMGIDAFSRTVGEVWSTVITDVAAATEEDQVLQSIYRGILNQAKSATVGFQWLGAPETYLSAGQSRKKINPLKYILLVPAFLLLLWDIFEKLNVKSYGGVVVYSIGLAVLAVALVLTIIDDFKTGPQAAAHAEQRIDVAAAWNSLERIASAADTHASALYSHMPQPDIRSEVDGLPLAAALLDWGCQDGQVPDELRTVLRTYLREHAIEAVAYSPERSSLFQLMPSNGTRTLEPALVKKVKTVRDGTVTEEEMLLRRGMACVKQDA